MNRKYKIAFCFNETSLKKKAFLSFKYFFFYQKNKSINNLKAENFHKQEVKNIFLYNQET
jgi:hypothetical protein